MGEKPLRIVQISDLHIFSNDTQALLGVKTRESLRSVIDLVLTDPNQPDMVLLTGDLSQDESEDSYLAVAEMINILRLPVYWIPGNHDDPKTMAKMYPRNNISNLKHIVLEHWHIILLDSKKPHAVEGFLDESQLRFMQHCLDMYPEHHAIVIFHHQPIPVGCVWLDRLGLTNADEMWNIIGKYPRAKHILFGHVHQQNEGEKNGVKYFSPPSTCIQFKRNSENFALEELNQGYRWVDLYPDGTLKTGICRVAEYVGVFDAKSKGY